MNQHTGLQKMAWCVLVIAVFSTVAHAANGDKEMNALKTPLLDHSILVYVGLCTDGQDYANQALANLGLTTVTTVTTINDLETQLAAGPWDLVIYDGYYSFPADTALTALNTYLSGGGRIIFAEANILSLKAHALFTAAGVTIVNDYTAPEPIYPWQNDPLFTTPNAVPSITVLSDLCNRDGVHLEPIVDQATAHAGSTETAATNKALVTVDAKRQFIFNGFAPQTITGDQDGDSKSDMVELYENEIHHLLFGGNGILVYFHECITSPDYVSEALDLFYDPGNVVMTNTFQDFLMQLTSGTWRLVIVDAYGNGVNEEILDELTRHYDKGGKTIFFSWDLFDFVGHAFLDRAGVTVLGEYETPLPVYDWGTSKLFTINFDLPDFTTLDHYCTVDGQYLQATTGIALAGSTATYDPTKATIVMDPHRRIILNGFAPGNINHNMSRLYYNEIALLLWGGEGTLVYWNNCNGTPDYISPALSSLGIADVTFTIDPLDFQTHLGSGYWDMVIYESYGGETTTEILDALLEFYDDQKSLIFSAYDLGDFMDHPLLANRAGVTLGTAYQDPQPVYAWNQSILFQSPNEVPALTTFSSPCEKDGQFLEVTTATAHAGYTAGPFANQTAIAVNQHKNLIVNGFLPGIMTGDADSDSIYDMVELYANEILYAKAGAMSGALVLFSECNGGLNYAEQTMGFSKTTVTNDEWFRIYLAAGDWGTVIYDSYSSMISEDLAVDLTDFYDNNGRIILSSYNLSTLAGQPLLDRAGVSPGTGFSATPPIYAWDVSPFFDTPNLLPNLTTFSDLCGFDGQNLLPVTASAIAGFTASPEAATTAITMNTDSRFIVNGFMPQNVTSDENSNSTVDMIELYQNELHALWMVCEELACPTDSFFSQVPYTPAESMLAYYSDVNVPYIVCEDFSGLTDPIGQIVWWGINAACEDSVEPDSFAVAFCEDNAGQPGAVIYEETVTPIREKLDIMYVKWWLNQYTITLATPQSIPSGWLKIHSLNEDSCWWAWMTSGQGNHVSYDEGSGPLATDFGVCFLPATASDIHSADTSGDSIIGLSELLRVIQFFNSNGFHCQSGTEDGFAPGPGDTSCSPHNSDYNPQNWLIGLSELLRIIQFFNSGGYHYCPSDGTEDGYCPGL